MPCALLMEIKTIYLNLNSLSFVIALTQDGCSYSPKFTTYYGDPHQALTNEAARLDEFSNFDSQVKLYHKDKPRWTETSLNNEK
ncbi:hypothetical protein L0F63_001614 [Massospora cicadina]|nr:hypothetical protein L0F63_001614 [Massospora cicadina]